MTEPVRSFPPTGRAARWGAALLLLPSSAAVFGGAVWWASATTPRAQPAPRPVQAAPAPPVDPHVIAARAALERKIAAHRQDSARLANRLAKLRAQITRAERAAHGHAVGGGTTTISQSNGGGGSVQPSSGGQGGGGGYQAPAPVVVAPAPPPPPPPVNTTTGASGKP